MTFFLKRKNDLFVEYTTGVEELSVIVDEVWKGIGKII